MVSGESGAGKTETSKHVIEHVTFICQESVGNLQERIVKVYNAVVTANKHKETCLVIKLSQSIHKLVASDIN